MAACHPRHAGAIDGMTHSSPDPEKGALNALRVVASNLPIQRARHRPTASGCHESDRNGRRPPRDASRPGLARCTYSTDPGVWCLHKSLGAWRGFPSPLPPIQRVRPDLLRSNPPMGSPEEDPRLLQLRAGAAPPLARPSPEGAPGHSVRGLHIGGRSPPDRQRFQKRDEYQSHAHCPGSCPTETGEHVRLVRSHPLRRIPQHWE